MINNPIYDQIIVVGVISNKMFNWYIANKYLWIMDLKKLSENDLKNYFLSEELKRVRENIIELSEKNVEYFLKRINIYKVNTDNLRLAILNKMLKQKEMLDLEDYYPVLLLDFDKKTLYSQYPEPFEFENYVPNSWEGRYMPFLEYIEENNKYWVYKNKNLFMNKN